MSTAKDIVYIDIDDEITSVIDKLKASKRQIVALVLPKRATMLQSTVNMRLLKRAAEETKKKLVLITSEAALLPLAGVTGLHVAKTLQSKPAIPPAPKVLDSAGGDEAQDPDAKLDASRPVGELASLSGADLDDTIEIDNDLLAPADTQSEKPAGGFTKISNAKKKLKIPNFENFRLKLLLCVLALVLLLVGWYVSFTVLPKASVIVKTDSSRITSTITLTASTTALEVDEEKSVVPAKTSEMVKTETEKIATTGEKNIGNKATGTVTLTNCSKDDETLTIPAGTGVSTGNLTFITTESATIQASNFTGSGVCKNDSSKTVAVEAQSPGDQYNISGGRTFSVAGFSSIKGTDSSSMGGGTNQMVKIVSQKDIDDARNKLIERGTETVKSELKAQLEQEGYIGLEDTTQGSEPTVTSSPNVGEEAAEVTVNGVVTYTILGFKAEDLQKLIDKEVDKSIEHDKQVILSYGLDTAVFRVLNFDGNTSARISLQTTVEAGPQLSLETVKQEITGKKKGQAREQLLARTGIEEVTINYSPFWVSKAPNNLDKITVIFESANEGHDQETDE